MAFPLPPLSIESSAIQPRLQGIHSLMGRQRKLNANTVCSSFRTSWRSLREDSHAWSRLSVSLVDHSHG